MAAPSASGAPSYVRIEDGTSARLAAVNAQNAQDVSLLDATSGNRATITAAGALNVAASGDTATNADGIPTRSTANVAQSLAIMLGFTGAAFDRIKSTNDNADGLGVVTGGAMIANARGYVYNGTTYDRHYSVSSVGDGLGVALAMSPSAQYGTASSTNAAANVVFAAVAGQKHRLMSAMSNYTGTVASAAAINIADNGSNIMATTGSTTVWAPPLPAGGMKQAAVNTQLVVSIAGGGVSATGWVLASKVTA